MFALASSAPVATALLLVIVVTSLIGLYAAAAMLDRNLFRLDWPLPKRQYATLATSGFLHADVPHLFFNGFTFWAFAIGLERAIGSLSFLALCIFGLLASGAGTWIKQRHNPGYQSLGGSGANLAVLFASIVYFPGRRCSFFHCPHPAKRVRMKLA